MTVVITTLATTSGVSDSSLILDANGDLFGTTVNGGNNGQGTVFEIVKTGNSYASTSTILTGFGSDYAPMGSLFLDSNGNLFGTLSLSLLTPDPPGYYTDSGAVFELAKTGNTYTQATLYEFTPWDGLNGGPFFPPPPNVIGAHPAGNLIADANGDLFGTTTTGGVNGAGTVFELVKSGTTYTAKVLVTFTGTNGSNPQSGLIADANGDLFGTTASGGTGGKGTVFEIVKTGATYASTPTILANFSGTNGANPYGGLVADANGDLFGTTKLGGANNLGTLFEIVKTGNTYASPITLLSFNGTNGANPDDTLIFDASGDLYGTTSSGGTNNHGTVFELVKTGNSYAGSPTTLLNFSAAKGSGLIADAHGNLFGTDNGTVYEISNLPTVVVSIANTDVNVANGTAAVTFVFSEAPAAFALADTSAVGGTLSNLQSLDATHYTATFTGAANTDIANAKVSVTAGSWANANGSLGAAGSTAVFTVDTVTPTVAVSIANTDINVGSLTGLVTFAFSAAPVSFTLSDTSAVGGTLSNLTSVDATHYTATFTGAADTKIANASVSVTAASWQNIDGNSGNGATSSAFAVDTVTPILFLTTLANTAGGSASGLILDANGDLFGTTATSNGATPDTVFEIVKTGNTYAGTPTILAGANYEPLGSLLADANGDLFGTTFWSSLSASGNGFYTDSGAIFEIAKTGTTYADSATLLYGFTPVDGMNSVPPPANVIGAHPAGNLIADANGDLFGTTTQGGANGAGTVFELVKTGGVYASTPTVLITFNGTNGGDPQSGLIADAQGDLFGTTASGGTGGKGTVFEIVKTGATYASAPITLLSFNGANGANPYAGLIADANGDLFGTTRLGGANNLGTVFEIVKTGATYASAPITLLSFDGTNGANPYASLIADANGDLFGTTFAGGTSNLGTIFEIVKTGTTYASTPATLLSFTGTNGSHPEGNLIADAAGDLFGTTLAGGTSGGTVFQITNSGFVVACYARGVLILTEAGEVAVEDLAIGDSVMTAGGIMRPIKWIGRRSYGGRFIIGRKDILPICFKAGSLEDNVPKRELWISPHHAMYLDGVLIEAKDLVNGASIVQAEQVEKVEYFHIELDSHDVIVAEGAFSESFVDDDSRGMFHNACDYAALYPNEAAGAARYCAPRLDDGYVIEAVRDRIAARAGLRPLAAGPSQLRGSVDVADARLIAGWAQSIEHPEAPVCLDVLADGEAIGQVLANRYRGDLEQAGLGSGRHSFEFRLPLGIASAGRSIEVRRSLDGARLGPAAIFETNGRTAQIRG